MFSTGVLTGDNMMPSFSTIANVDCGHPGNIQYGTVNVSEGTKIHARIYYTCDRGYRLYGIRSNRICRYDGTWSEGEPTCGGMYYQYKHAWHSRLRPISEQLTLLY